MSTPRQRPPVVPRPLGEVSVWLSSWTWVPAYALLLAVDPAPPPGRHPVPAGSRGGGTGSGSRRSSSPRSPGCCAPTTSSTRLRRPPWLWARATRSASPGWPRASRSAWCSSLAALPPGCRRSCSAGEGRRTGPRSALGAGRLRAHRRLPRWRVSAATGAGPGWPLRPCCSPAALLFGAATRSAALDAELRETRARLALAREEERRRLRHDLHDSLGPALAGVALQLEALPADIETSPARAAETAERLTDPDPGRRRRGTPTGGRARSRRLARPGRGPAGAGGRVRHRRAADHPRDDARRRSATSPPRWRPPPSAWSASRSPTWPATRAPTGARSRCSAAPTTSWSPCATTVGALEAARGSGSAGTGVGLLSMRAVTQEIGGTCTVSDAERWRHRGAGRAAGGSAMRVLLVDDHPVFREGMRAVLGALSEVELVGEASDGDVRGAPDGRARARRRRSWTSTCPG